jgi:hypothetical protein
VNEVCPIESVSPKLVVHGNSITPEKSASRIEMLRVPHGKTNLLFPLRSHSAFALLSADIDTVLNWWLQKMDLR